MFTQSQYWMIDIIFDRDNSTSTCSFCSSRGALRPTGRYLRGRVAAGGQWPVADGRMRNDQWILCYLEDIIYIYIIYTLYIHIIYIYIHIICMYIYNKVTQNNHLLQKNQDYPSAGVFLVHFPLGDSEVLLGFCWVVPVGASWRSFNRTAVRCLSPPAMVDVMTWVNV